MANFVVLDTETSSIEPCSRLVPSKQRVYDLGYMIVDGKTFEILKSRSLIIRETFDNDGIMGGAYYAAKLPYYRANRDGSGTDAWQTASFLDAYREFAEDCKAYKVKTVWAYNCNFDLQALNATIRDYSNGFRSFFFPYGVKVRDIWDYASCITSSPKYLDHIERYGLLTPNGNPRTDVETVFRFLTNNPQFCERHTALEDCKIELEILKVAKRKHTRKRKTCGCGWRDAAAQYHAR